jgi:hypothetical protein
MEHRSEDLTVGALKKLLKGISDDTIIVAATDPEGNSYRPVIDHTLGLNYDDANMVVGPAEITDEDKMRLGYTDEDVVEGEACLLLWPR